MDRRLAIRSALFGIQGSLDVIDGVAERMHGMAHPLDAPGSDCSLNGAAGMHGTAHASGDKKPGQEAHAGDGRPAQGAAFSLNQVVTRLPPNDSFLHGM
jgi:hypothetical protein